jgi:hypothetical protein
MAVIRKFKFDPPLVLSPGEYAYRIVDDRLEIKPMEPDANLNSVFSAKNTLEIDAAEIDWSKPIPIRLQLKPGA